MIIISSNLESYHLVKAVMTSVKRNPSRLIAIDITRVAVFIYFVTFGFFGYGSAIELHSVLTWIPALAGLVSGLLLGSSRQNLSIIWSLKLSEAKKGALQYLALLSVFGCTLWPSIGGELSKDELAHVRFASTHAREILVRLDLFESTMASSSAIQMLSFAVLFLVIVPLALFIAFVPLKRMIISIAFVTFCFQVGYWFFGSWGWGYAEVSWFPFFVTSSIFGFHSLVFSLTSVAIVAAGLFAFFVGLQRLGINLFFRVMLVGTVATIPVVTPVFSSVDHVLYFAIFGLPALIIFASKPDYQRLKLGVLLLSVGVLFRITLIVPLVVMLVLFLMSCRNQKRSVWREFQSHPGVMLLAPYCVGFLIFPPLFSGGVTSALAQTNMTGQEWSASPLIDGIGQAGIFLSLLIIAGFVASLFSAKNFAISVTLVASFAYLYFFVLTGTGLTGDPRYTAEWLLTLTAWSLISLLLLAMRIRSLKVNWIPFASYLGVVAVMLSTNLLTLAHQNSVISLDVQSLQGRQPVATIGYMEAQAYIVSNVKTDCTPVGQVYGASNELLAGRDIASFKRAISTFFEVQAAEVAAGGIWTNVSASTLEALPISCIYGSKEAFNGIDLNLWEAWDVTFPRGSDLNLYSVRVLEKTR
jgi:hypothetical protein